MPSNRNVGNRIGSTEYKFIDGVGDNFRKGYPQASIVQDVIISPRVGTVSANPILNESMSVATFFDVSAVALATADWPRRVGIAITGAGADVDVTIAGDNQFGVATSEVVTVSPGGAVAYTVVPFSQVDTVSCSATSGGLIKVHYSTFFALSAPKLGTTFIAAFAVDETTGATVDFTSIVQYGTTVAGSATFLPDPIPDANISYYVIYFSGGTLGTFSNLS